jgi:glycosyltransferase involved in cell wall biosynthesis
VSEPPLRIALLGGVPPSLGGGGLELQVQRTRAALERRGHEVFHVARESAQRPFDVLHAFSSGPDVHFFLEHWRRNPAPLVVSPVIVVAPGHAERRQRIGSRLRIPAFGPRMRVEILRRADAAVALTAYEADLVRAFAGRAAPRTVVIPNGVDRADVPEGPPDLPHGYVVLLGTVSVRKHQAATIAALGKAGVSPVVAGGCEGTDAERAAFERELRAAGGRWLGEVDTATARSVVAGARALVHLSRAEGQSLAILEAIAEGTPAIVSPLPANRELAVSYPSHIVLCGDLAGLPRALGALGSERRAPAPVPTWDDVAARLEQVYRGVGARGA